MKEFMEKALGGGRVAS
jgi:EF-hand domain-containing protein 1